MCGCGMWMALIVWKYARTEAWTLGIQQLLWHFSFHSLSLYGKLALCCSCSVLWVCCYWSNFKFVLSVCMSVCLLVSQSDPNPPQHSMTFHINGVFCSTISLWQHVWTKYVHAENGNCKSSKNNSNYKTTWKKANVSELACSKKAQHFFSTSNRELRLNRFLFFETCSEEKALSISK